MTVAASLQPTQRLLSIDFVRGLVVVIMALDHARDLMHTDSFTHDPLDLSATTPVLFFTRWITHFCAPVFVFLAGTSAYLMMKGQASHASTRRFLFTRGVWLIFLEVTIVSFGIWCDVKFRTLLFQVIFAIGSSFVILSALIGLSSRVLGLIGLTVILLHDLLPSQPFGHDAAEQGGSLWWGLMIAGGFFKLSADHALVVGYPVIPWLGIMLLGFGFGKAFNLPVEKRQKLFFISGCSALLLFIMLRAFNVYGDPKPWEHQQNIMLSMFSFINVSKYPPSLLYTLVTLGTMFFVLCLAEGRSNAFMRFFVTYGRVPMFFYLLHWYVIHASMFVMLMLQGIDWQQLTFGIMQFGRPAGAGIALRYVHLYWICLVFALYFPCRRYGRYKAANKNIAWLSYL